MGHTQPVNQYSVQFGTNITIYRQSFLLMNIQGSRPRSQEGGMQQGKSLNIIFRPLLSPFPSSPLLPFLIPFCRPQIQLCINRSAGSRAALHQWLHFVFSHGILVTIFLTATTV